ncbi:hypothetical protein [Peribacillus butanolivorans]|uniref:hypothetical protein n=1 Tax=Peribacillus butanolivorans TaxID=421767 RepID=UPI0036DF0D14
MSDVIFWLMTEEARLYYIENHPNVPPENQTKNRVFSKIHTYDDLRKQLMEGG